MTLAAARGAELVAFPELSLTGYEPQLALALASDLDDPRLDVFQELSDRNGMRVAVGLPTRAAPRPRITLALFAPNSPRSSYSKRYLHADEEPYFSQGSSNIGLVESSPRIALAICYELSVPEHARTAFEGGAELYLCSVAKTATGVERAHPRLADIAREHGAQVLMVNCIGPSGDGECAGASAVWNGRGELLGKLGATDEGLIIFDTATEKTVVHRP
jgi:predicted amidohydrolase